MVATGLVDCRVAVVVVLVELFGFLCFAMVGRLGCGCCRCRGGCRCGGEAGCSCCGAFDGSEAVVGCSVLCLVWCFATA
jgi:hypothetical protein